jgi:hypothetical protein
LTTVVALMGAIAVVCDLQAGASASSVLTQAPQKLVQQAGVAVTGGRVVRSLLLRGTVREGFDGVTGKFGGLYGAVEYRILMPDCFLRSKTWEQANEVVRMGFRQGAVITPDSPAPAKRAARLLAYQGEFARFVLGVLARADTVFPLRPTQAEGDTVQLVGADGSDISLDLDTHTGAPVRVRYMALEGFPTPLPRNPATKSVAAAPLKYERVEESLVFEDRREEGGINLPHLIRRTARGVTFEEVHLTEVVVNPPLSPTDFK